MRSFVAVRVTAKAPFFMQCLRHLLLALLPLGVCVLSLFISATFFFVENAKDAVQPQLSRQISFHRCHNLVQNPHTRKASLFNATTNRKKNRFSGVLHQHSSSSLPSPLHSWFATLTDSVSFSCASLFPSVSFCRSILSSIAGVRTPQHSSCTGLFPWSCGLPGFFFSGRWKLLHVSFSSLLSSLPLTSVSRRNAAVPASSLVLLPHTLPAAAAATFSGVRTPEANSETAHRSGPPTPSRTSPRRISKAERGQDETAGKRVIPPSDETLERFYSNFPDPAPPPAGVIELDVATWDIIANVMAAPQFFSEEKQQQQLDVRKEALSTTQAQEQEPQQQESSGQHDQEQRKSEQQQLKGSPNEAAASSPSKLEHSAIPAPPRLWLVAFMASGCAHCQRLRPILHQLQRVYSRTLQRLRAARRHALAVEQQEATAALSVASGATAAAHRGLRLLSGRNTPEPVIKLAEQHIVMRQQEEQALQQKLLVKISQLYAAAATAAWAYPDTVFATFDCMQNREHQAVCEHVLGISKFPTVLLLRRLPLLSTLAARAAEEPSLPNSLLCPSSLLRRRHSSAAHVSSVAASGAATGDRVNSTAAGRTAGEREELHFTSAPLLHERLGEHRRRALAAAAAEGLRKVGTEKTVLLCALQEELLAEFPLFLNPSLQRLLLFLYGSAAEVASWAPVVPPPAGFLQYVLLSGTASPAARSASAAGPAASEGAATEVLRLRAAAAEKAEADAVTAAALTAANFLEKEQIRNNSNNFPTWLANRMRGEALRQVVSAEEIRLLHYGTAKTANSSNSCSSPTVSFVVCLDLARVLQTERGDDPQSTIRLPQQFQPHQQRRQPQQQRQTHNNMMRRATVIRGHAVRLDGLRDAFETFAAAAGELRREHFFLYSLDPAACSPGVLQTGNTYTAAAEPLLLKMQEHSVTAADTAEATARAAAAANSSPGAVGGDHGSKREQHPLRVMALQPGLLLQEGEDGDACEGAEETDEAAKVANRGDEGETETVDDEESDQQQDEMKRSNTVRERRKVLLLQHILESIWTAQRTVAFQQQQVVEDEADQHEGEAAAGLLYEHRQKREEKKCRQKKGSAHQGRCVDPQEQEQEQQQQQQRLTYVPLPHQQRQDESCGLEENESIDPMHLPTYVGPFPARMDHLRATASEKGLAAAAIASFFSATPSPPLASFLDIFRMPILPVIGEGNFMHLRVSSSSSWLSAASSGSTNSRSRQDIPEVGRRQLVVAALDLRVLDMLLELFQKPQIAAAVDRALQQQQQAAIFARMPTVAAAGSSDAEDVQPSEDKRSAVVDAVTKSRSHAAEKKQTRSSNVNSRNASTSVGHSNRSDNNSIDHSTMSSGTSSSLSSSAGWLGSCLFWLRSVFIPPSGSAETAEELSMEQLLVTGPFSSSFLVPSLSNTAFDAKRVDLVAAALSDAVFHSSRDNPVATAAASRLLKLVDELWQLSWTAKEVLLHSQMDLLQPLNRDRDDRDSRYSSSRRSRMTVFSSPFVFGILDGFGYSDSLADFDVHAKEEGELPAVLAFDPLLPPSGGEFTTSSNSCNGSHKESCSSAEGSADQRHKVDGTLYRRGVDLRSADGDGAGAGAISAGRGKKSGRGYVPYYYRDRLRLRLEDLPLGLSLLRVRALEGRRMTEEEEDEEDDDKESSFLVLFGRVVGGFTRMGRRIGTWLRKEYKAASRSRLALIRLVFSLCAFFLVLACTFILVFYTVCCPSKSAADPEEEAASEADTVDTAELDTENEEDDEEEEEEEEEERGADNEKTFTTSGDSRGNTDNTAVCKRDKNEPSNPPDNSSSNNSTIHSSGNKTRSEEPKVPSVEEVRRRAEKMLLKRR